MKNRNKLRGSFHRNLLEAIHAAAAEETDDLSFLGEVEIYDDDEGCPDETDFWIMSEIEYIRRANGWQEHEMQCAREDLMDDPFWDTRYDWECDDDALDDIQLTGEEDWDYYGEDMFDPAPDIIDKDLEPSELEAILQQARKERGYPPHFDD